MPGLNGIELIAAVRSEPHSAEIPIMMITASGQRAVRVEGLDRGANDVLSKPIEAAEVRARTKASQQRKAGGHSAAAADGL